MTRIPRFSSPAILPSLLSRTNDASPSLLHATASELRAAAFPPKGRGSTQGREPDEGIAPYGSRRGSPVCRWHRVHPREFNTQNLGYAESQVISSENNMRLYKGVQERPLFQHEIAVDPARCPP